jgi:short-subunit dehydrogenase
MDPSGKVVILTGASAGIGAATARAFAAAGARLVLAARDASRLEALRRELPGEHLAVPTDIADRAAVEALVARALEAYTAIDMVISNAGVGLAGPIAELRDTDLERALAVNLYGPLWLTQAALPHLRARPRGQLIYVSSTVGLRALPYLGGYAASKAALDRLTESLRVELRGSGVRVTLVRPGTTRTEFRERRLGAGREQRRAGPRGVPPERVAQAILRAARREPRVAYVSLADRLMVLGGLLLPGLADIALGRAFGWQNQTGEG